MAEYRRRHGSLFSGIGGELLAAKWMGWENVFWVEKKQRNRDLLRRRFPEASGFSRIEWFNGLEYEGRIDIASGGFPCKQTSIGAAISKKRIGLNGIDSGLWYEQLRVYEELKAPWVVVENVAGVKKWKDQIQDSLEGIGYTVSILEHTLDSFGLPNKRRRVFFVGNANGKRLEIAWPPGSPTTEWVERLTTTGGAWLQSSPGDGRGIIGLSDRVDRIEALGNSCSPLSMFEIFKEIENVTLEI